MEEHSPDDYKNMARRDREMPSRPPAQCFNVELKKISFAIHWSSYNYNLIPSILSSWSRRQNKCHPGYKWCQMLVPHTALWCIKVGWRNKNQIENTIWEGEPSTSNIHSNYSFSRELRRIGPLCDVINQLMIN